MNLPMCTESTEPSVSQAERICVHTTLMFVLVCEAEARLERYIRFNKRTFPTEKTVSDLDVSVVS